MKPKIVAIAAALLLVASACDRIPFVGGGGDDRTILVDYSHDEFASFFLYNFPSKIAVTPGTNLIFRQTWTGEPHTVTGGTMVDEALGNPLLRFVMAFENLLSAGVEMPDPEDPGDATVGDAIKAVEDSEESADRDTFLSSYDELAEDGDFPDRDEADEVSFGEFVEEVDPQIEEAFSSLPFAFDESFDESEEGEALIAQNVGQPCYLTKGGPPKKAQQPCREQDQPAFDGSQSYYNSGIIPYEGPQGNTYEVQLADDIEPGKYNFYCAVHGFIQSTEVEVRPEGSEVPTQEEISRQARREIDAAAGAIEDVYRTAVQRNRLDFRGETLRGPFAGLATPAGGPTAINEFVPKAMDVRAGEPITWKMIGAEHTITFGVPRYFPIVEFLDDGTVRINPRLDKAAGGATEPPEQEGEGVFEIDGGTYDGDGFWSSGLIGAEPYLEYTMRISEPGTYDYACLLHPPMVGKITVT